MILDITSNLINDHRIILPMATLAGAYSLLIWYKHNVHNKDNKDNRNLKQDVKKWMLQDFKNKIITWKNNNPDKKEDYLLFIQEVFPENITIENNKVISIDKRIMGDAWKGTFYHIKDSDKIIILDTPPGCL